LQKVCGISRDGGAPRRLLQFDGVIGQEKNMKTLNCWIVIISFMVCAQAVAQTDLTGTWQGKLAVGKNETINIQFIITKDAKGSYKAVVNSPDSETIKNVPAGAVKFNGGKLSIDVASLSGSYAGTMIKDAFSGEWRQQGNVFPLTLTQYKAPTASALKPLIGEWVGRTTNVDKSVEIEIVRFQMAKDGKMTGTMDIPGLGARRIPITDIMLAKKEVSFKIPAGQAEYAGQLNINKISGVIKQPGQERKMELTRGKYVPPPAYISLPPEAMQKLLGQWGGKWQVGEDLMTVTFKFEKTKEGKYLGFTNSPEQGDEFLPLTNVTLEGDKVSFKIPQTNGEYSGRLEGNTISGTYITGGQQYIITVTRGVKIEPLIQQVDIPIGMFKNLLGKWQGNLGTAVIVLSFEQNVKGKKLIYVDAPDLGAKRLPALKASIVSDKLSIRLAGAGYSGTIKGNKLDGFLDANGQSIPLPLTKE
jgi:hypothetical protein